MKPNPLKKQLERRELTIGSWLTIGHPAVPEILASAGFDWLAIDIEHTTIDLAMTQTMISAIQSQGIPALVRVSRNEEVVIKRVLDAGADGVIVPMICSEEDAERAVGYAKYPPRGRRGVGLARAQNYGIGFGDYKKWVEENLVVIAQIEHIDGIRNLDRILSVDGIDGTMIGPYDLSGSLGKPGDFDSPDVAEALAQYRETCVARNSPMGFHVVDTDHSKLEMKMADGYKFLAYGTDFLFMGDCARAGMKSLRR